MIKTLSIIRNDLAERRLTQALHKYTQLDGGALKKEDLKSLLQELGKREPAEKAREPTDKELLWVIQEATTEVLHFVDNNEKTGADMEYWVRKLKRCDLPRAVVSWEHYMRQSSEIEKIFKEFDDDEVRNLLCVNLLCVHAPIFVRSHKPFVNLLCVHARNLCVFCLCVKPLTKHLNTQRLVQEPPRLCQSLS
jgi:hypothetical protein